MHKQKPNSKTGCNKLQCCMIPRNFLSYDRQGMAMFHKYLIPCLPQIGSFFPGWQYEMFLLENVYLKVLYFSKTTVAGNRQRKVQWNYAFGTEAFGHNKIVAARKNCNISLAVYQIFKTGMGNRHIKNFEIYFRILLFHPQTNISQIYILISNTVNCN